MEIFMDNVDCSGMENRLVDCPFDGHTADCTHAEDAGVRCQDSMSPVFLSQKYIDNIMILAKVIIVSCAPFRQHHMH